MWQPRCLNNKTGMSIIEVLVALAVFTVGIMTVIRVFPTGLGIVKQSENATLADRLAQSELERWKDQTANLPAGMYCMIPTGSACNPVGPITGIDPDDLGTLKDSNGTGYDGYCTSGNTASPYYYSDINKFRHVEAECTQIPSPQPTSAGSNPGSVYVLGFSPVICAGDANNNPVNIYSAPLDRVTYPANGSPNLTADFQYSIDYTNGQIYVLPVAYTRYFVVKYAFWQDPKTGTGENPRLTYFTPTTYQKIYVMANAKSAMIPGPTSTHVTDEPGFVSIQPGSDTLHRAFIERDNTHVWGSDSSGNDPNDTLDPYQYEVVDRYAGVISFNPLGYRYNVLTARGKERLKAYIDYDVADWHIIREERRVPDASASGLNTDFSVRLTLPYIKHMAATVQAGNVTAYTGLHPNLACDLLIIDLGDGKVYKSYGNHADNLSSSPLYLSATELALHPEYRWSDGTLDVFKIDYKNGVIQFNPYFAGHNFRIHYRAEGDWGMQTYKAYDLYTQSYSTDPKTIGYQQYMPDYNLNYDKTIKLDANNNPSLTGKVFFPECYRGRSVAVDFTYTCTDPSRPPSTDVHGQICAIAQDPATKYWYVNLNDCLANVNTQLTNNGYAKAVVTRVSKVCGITLGVKVIWRNDHSNASHSPWKIKDLQTFLQRSSE